MGKTILAVVVGYVVMALLVFGLLTVAYLAMSVDRVFEPGTYEPSITWILVMCVVGFLAAFLGAKVAQKISNSPGTINGLLGVIVVLGVLMLGLMMAAPKVDPGERPESVSSMKAMEMAQTPIWAQVLNIFIGVGGVLLARSKALSSEVTPTPED